MAELKHVFKELPCPGVIIKKDKFIKHPHIECWFTNVKEQSNKILFYNVHGGLTVVFKGETSTSREYVESLGIVINVIKRDDAEYYVFPENIFERIGVV